MKEQIIADLAADLRNIRECFDRSTRNLAEEDSDFAPAPGVFTAAQVVAHVAQTVEWFFEGAFRPEGFSTDWEAMDREVRAVTSLAEARRWIERAFAAGEAAIAAHSAQEWEAPLPDGPIMGGAPRYAILGAIRDHTAHHRGALTVYTRLRGKVPPMPYVEAPEG
ncbi:MAG: DinB family protein [Bryobacteraceae bacterium]|nr:DinB family protein [Bryobacteraceae bacterium]